MAKPATDANGFLVAADAFVARELAPVRLRSGRKLLGALRTPMGASSLATKGGFLAAVVFFVGLQRFEPFALERFAQLGAFEALFQQRCHRHFARNPGCTA